MAAIQSRTSRLAVTVESTEGTPVSPTASTEYIALQDDFAMDPSFDTLENAELKASLGASKSILGAENPTASFSHYLRHSGVEGQAPGYGDLLEAAFGSETVVGTERDTVVGSTTTAINVDVGEGVEFPRGRPLLIKNASGGYEMRVVHSVAGDVLSPSFALANAPASGVNLGLPVYYTPADSGHQSLSVWHYAGNGGAVQMMSGARVSDISFEFPAGDLINASYSLEGLEYFFDPIEIAAADTYLDFTDDAGTFAVQISAKMYKDPHELAAALETAMNAATTETHAVNYSDTTGKFTISTSTSVVFTLLWSTGANAANTVGDKLGFSTAADDTGSISYVSDNAQSYATPQSPSFDNSDPLAAKANHLFIGDQDDNVCVDASSVSVSLGTPRRVIESICADSGRSGSIINGRTVTVSVTALLNQYDVDKFRRFREGSETRLQYGFGIKSGGNWVPGKCGVLYLPTTTITSFSITDDDGLFVLNAEFTAFVDSDGNGEVYLGFL